MRILMIAPTPFFADRGCHTRIYEEVMGLQKLGHQVEVCTYGLGRDVGGVKTVRTINFPWYKKLSAGPSKTKILLLPCLGVTCLKEIKRCRPDVIHAHLHEGACIAHVCKLFYPRCKYVFDMQGGLVDEVLQHGFIKEGGIGYRFLRWLEKRIVNWQHIITSSSHMVDDVIKIGCPPDNVTNVKDGVDTDFFCPRKEDMALAGEIGLDLTSPRISYVGLLEEYQGIDLLIQAMKCVCAEIPNAQLILMGYPNIEKYKTQCREAGIERNVIFTGAVSYLELPRYLSLSHIGVAPKLSAAEGNGKVYNYMSMEMASVVFDGKINREILEETGIFVENRTAEELAEKIIWAMKNPGEVERLGKQGRKIAEKRLSNVAVAQRIEEVYRRL